MCLVTVFFVDKTRKKYFVNDSYANVCAAIQRMVGSFENIIVEPVIRKDLSSLTAILYANKLKNDSITRNDQTIQKKPQIFPKFEDFEKK